MSTNKQECADQQTLFIYCMLSVFSSETILFVQGGECMLVSSLPMHYNIILVMWTRATSKIWILWELYIRLVLVLICYL